MVQIIIGNMIALIASVIIVYSGYLKQKNEILYAQTVQIGLYMISNIVLGGITGAIINAISYIRNILCYKEKLNNLVKIILIVLAIVLSLCFNNLGVIGLLPVISSIVYKLFCFIYLLYSFLIKWYINNSLCFFQFIPFVLSMSYKIYFHSYLLSRTAMFSV